MRSYEKEGGEGRGGSSFAVLTSNHCFALVKSYPNAIASYSSSLGSYARHHSFKGESWSSHISSLNLPRPQLASIFKSSSIGLLTGGRVPGQVFPFTIAGFSEWLVEVIFKVFANANLLKEFIWNAFIPLNWMRHSANTRSKEIIVVVCHKWSKRLSLESMSIYYVLICSRC